MSGDLWEHQRKDSGIKTDVQGYSKTSRPGIFRHLLILITHTYFKDDYRRQGPAVPGSRPYEQLKKLRTGIERYYGLTKENRYRMEVNNTYMGHDNVLIHVIEHDI